MSAPPRLDRTVAEGLPAYGSDPLTFLSTVSAQGDVVAYTFNGEERVLLSSPQDVHTVLTAWPEASRSTPITRTAAAVIGDGLIVATEPRWRPRRMVIQRELTHRSVHRFAQVLTDNIEERVRGWAEAGEFDLQDGVGSLALDNLGDTVFGTDFREFSDTLQDALRESQLAIDAVVENRFGEAERNRQEGAARRLNEFVARLVEARRIEPVTGTDILGVLVASRETGDAAFRDPWLTDEAVTIIMAGHETTAFTTTMALWRLSQEDGIRGRLRRELRDAVDRGTPLTALADEVPLCRTVIQETLRLYPPLPALHRLAQEDVEFGGHQVVSGTMVVVSPYAIHHDPRNWPDPEVFDPDRFSEERRRDLPRHAYLPFGAGARICAGNHFALLEAALIVAVTTLRLDLVPVSPPPRLVDRGTALRCAEPLVVRAAPVIPHATSIAKDVSP